MNTNHTRAEVDLESFTFEALEELHAPSENSWWQGLLGGVTVVGIGVAILT